MMARSARATSLVHIARVLAIVASMVSSAALAEGLSGRPVADVLEGLNADGARILFSTDLVPRSLIVLEEPRSTSDLARLIEDVLAPHGLGVTKEGDSFVVVRRPRGGLDGVVVLTPGRRPLAGADVRLVPGDQRMRSASGGTFAFDRVPAGTYEVQVTFAPMDPITRTVTIEAGRRVQVDVEIPLEPLTVREITVTPSKVTIAERTVSSTVQRTTELGLVPSIGGEVVNAVARIPGVSADDSSAAMRVRGSTERDSMIVVDGLELYEPFHLTSYQSPFSLIDSGTVGRLEFTSGSTTAEYGDRQGGILEIDPISGMETGGTRLSVGTSNTRVMTGGALGGRGGSWLASARVWYPDAVVDTITRDGQAIEPGFADAYAQASLRLADRHRVTVNTLASFDSVEFTSEDGEDITQDSAWRAYAWAKLTSAWTSRVLSKTVVSMGVLDDARESSIAQDDEDPRVEWTDDRTVRFVGVKQDWEVDFGEAVLGRFGADLRSLNSSYRFIQTEFPTTGPEIDQTRLEPAGHATALYASPRFRLGPKLALEAGLRWDRQSYTSEDQVSPRFHFVVNATPRTALRFGWGHYFQSQRIYELNIADGETQFSPAQRSEDFVVSAAHRLPSGIRVRADLYTKQVDRLQPRFENEFNRAELFPAREEDRIRIDAEQARLAGIELLARSDEGERWTWWVSYARSRARERVDGTFVRRSWDQPNSAKFSVSYRPSSRWTVSLAGSYHTGWPMTPVTGRAVVAPDGSTTAELVAGPRNSARLPDYMRVDAKLRRQISVRRGELQLDLDILNLFDRNNVCCIGDIDANLMPDGSVTTTREEIPWIGITPTLSLTWRM